MNSRNRRLQHLECRVRQTRASQLSEASSRKSSIRFVFFYSESEGFEFKRKHERVMHVGRTDGAGDFRRSKIASKCRIRMKEMFSFKRQYLFVLRHQFMHEFHRVTFSRRCFRYDGDVWNSSSHADGHDPSNSICRHTFRSGTS